MKKHFCIIAIILLSLLSLKSKASHFVGSDISYKCTSTPNVYMVTMKIYRDCSGIPLCTGCNNPIPNGSVAGCNTSSSGFTTQIIGATAPYIGVNYGSFTLNIVPSSSGYDIIQLCNSVQTVCTNCNTRTAGTFSPGIEVYTYEGMVNLSTIPSACCNVILGANACCRNAATTTLIPGGFQALCTVNKCQTSCNSAPIFTHDAIPLICAGVDIVYNLGAMDPDGDSLSYAFGESYQGINSPVTYNASFRKTNPFPYLNSPDSAATYPGGLRIDPVTGDIMFRAVGVFVTFLVIEVTQWKLVNGVRVNVGMTRRDVQFQTNLCLPNKSPIIKVYKDNILHSGINSFTAKAGTQLCLDIVSEDQFQLPNSTNGNITILADTTDISWNNPGFYIPAMANATFTRNYILSQRTINGPKADSFKFCWNPPLSAIRQEPYFFTVKGTETPCSKSFVIRGISIKVESPKTIFVDGSTKSIYCNNKITSTNVNYRTSGLNLFSGNVFTVQLSDSSGSFTNATNIGNKVATDTVGFIPISIPTGLFLNRNYKIRVNASSDNLNLGTAYAINLVAGFSTPIITNNRDSFCKGLLSTFKVTPNTVGLTYKWLKNNAIMANETRDSLMVDSAHTYKAIVSNTGCSDTSNAKYLTVYPKPIVNFTAPTYVCLKNANASINLLNTSNISSGSMSYTWKFSDTSNSNLLSPTKTVTDTGNLVVKLIATSNNGCKDSMSKTINIRKAPIALFYTYDTVQCITNNYFEFWNQSEDNGLSNQYTWNFGVGSNVISNNLFRFFSYNYAGTYAVKLIALSSNYCADTITQLVTVASKATAVNFSVNKTAQCLSNNNFIFTNQSTPNNNSLKYKWDFGNGDTSTQQSPSYHYNMLGGTSVKLVVTANNVCLDSITKFVSVSAEAIANFSVANVAQCLTGNNFIFTNSSTNSTSQTWSFGDGNNSSVLNPTKTYATAGSFVVKLLAKNNANCNDSITKNVTVYPNTNLSFGINNASQCLKNNLFNFTNTSSISSGSASYRWILGEADTSSISSKSFTQSGNYKIYLLSLTDQNCIDSMSKDITVNVSPTIGNITGNIVPNSISTPFTYSVLSQANSNYNWAVNNGTIQSGQGTNAVSVLWTSLGSGSLMAKITNNNGCIDSTILPINISVGINNLSLDNDLNIYPNPTKSSIIITNKNNLVGKKYMITNLVGQILISGKLNIDETIVNLETLQSGLYLLSIDGMNKQSIKVIKE
jgi:PKD repeat protein